MATNQNNNQSINLIKKYIDEVYSKGNCAIMDQLCTQNIILHDSALPNRINGLNALKDLEKMYSNAFPEKKAKIDEIIPSLDNPENLITIRWTVQGTHKGEFCGLAPTNKPFTISGITIFHLSNGKISEMHLSWDRLSLLEQLGLTSKAAILSSAIKQGAASASNQKATAGSL